ncbi:putative F-box protein At3g20705 [Vicia villosa]|uniref:putative F-box protein At3g20705 n=1 Tax=Vicia villosa TaxID=3911 RepID=UPI00273C75FB|nr:putative F-box protein At3g20705 [Vicia villosa]
MEKSVSAVTNKKVCINLPHDLVLLILSKLPLCESKRLRCVCKSWSLVFKNPHFINMYISHLTRYNHSSHGDKFLVLHKLLPGEFVYEIDSWHCEFYWFSSDKFENWVKLDWPSQFRNDDCNIYVVGSVSINGILCLKQRFKTRQLVLWNPTTTEAKVIPRSPVENSPSDHPSPWRFLHGFGYDHVSDDYKVVQMIDYNVRDGTGDLIWRDRFYDPLWEIYSVKTNSWKKQDFDMGDFNDFSVSGSIGVYMDGLYHWWARSESENINEYLMSNNIEEYLMSFEFSTEMLIKTPMPKDIDGRFERNLVMLNGSIALISTSPEKATAFGISILGKLGVRESWMNLIIVESLPFVEFPIRVGKSNNVVISNEDSNKLLILEDKRLVWVDLSTQMIGRFHVNGDKLGTCQMGRYKKSFDPIETINS